MGESGKAAQFENRAVIIMRMAVISLLFLYPHPSIQKKSGNAVGGAKKSNASDSVFR